MAKTDQRTLARSNVVAAFTTVEGARTAIADIRDAGFADDEISLLARDPNVPPAEGESFEEPAKVGGQMATGMAKGGAVGGTIGGLTGLIAGAIAFGIPGIGPAVGAGIWIATGTGAAAGATAG